MSKGQFFSGIPNNTEERAKPRVQVIKCILKFVFKDSRPIVKRLRDDTSIYVILPQHSIKKEEAEICSDSDLTAFKYELEWVKICRYLLLRPIEVKLNPLALAVLDPIEVVEPPLRVCKLRKLLRNVL